MKPLKPLFLLVAILFATAIATQAQNYCSNIRGEVEIYDIPHGHAELKLTRYSPTFIEIPVTVNPYNGYFTVAPTLGSSTWYLTVQYVMDSGYESVSTAGTWSFWFSGLTGDVSVQNQLTFVLNDPCTNPDPYDDLPWYFYTKFNSSDTCAGFAITGKVRDQNSKPGLPDKMVGVDFLVPSGAYQGNWLHIADPVTNSAGWWTHTIPQNGTGGKCGRFRISAPEFEWPTYGYNIEGGGSNQQYVDVFKSSDTTTYARNYIRSPL